MKSGTYTQFYIQISFLISLFLQIAAFSQDIQEKVSPPFLNYGKDWVDSVFNTLSPDERIAQLIFVAAYSNKDIVHEVEITDLAVRRLLGFDLNHRSRWHSQRGRDGPAPAAVRFLASEKKGRLRCGGR